MENDNKEVLSKIEKLREEYQAELQDKNEEELSFLDKMNDLVRTIFKDHSLSVYTVFSEQKLDEWKRKKFIRWIKNLFNKNIKNIFYLTLLTSITGFLVSEALDFYSDGDVVDFKTYVKAILTEVCFIFLSGYRSSTRLQSVGVSLLRVSIFCLMLFVITSKTFIDSSVNIGNTVSIESQVVLLQKQIDEKEKTIEFYKQKNWPVTTKQLTMEKDKLVDKLIELKQKQAEGANKDVSDLVKYKSYGKAFFRVLLLFISLLISRRIFSF